MGFAEKIADDVRKVVHDDILRANLFAGGEIFFVVEDSDTAYQSVSQRYGSNVYTTLTAAEAAAVSNRDDIILMSASSTHSVAAGIAWDKNRIHVMGMDTGGRIVQQGTKVQNAAADTTAYVIKVTGVRNTFRNIKFIQASTNSAALHVLEEGGEGNLYEFCSFVFGVVNNLDETTATEVLCGSDSATFRKCLFGTETLLTSAARAVFTIDQVTSGQEFKSNISEDCIFMISSSDNGALLIKVAANSDVLFTNLFIRPIFMASVDSAGGIALTNAVASASGLVKGTINLYLPASFNCTSLCAGVTDQVMTYAPATAAAGGEAGTPT